MRASLIVARHALGTTTTARRAQYARARASFALRDRARASSSSSRAHGRLKATMATSDGTGATARVVTYNVLSSHLADPGYFTHCDPDDLRAETRLERVMAKLDAECAGRAVIGLQEVSMSWAGPLHAYFAKKGYTFILSLYGKPFNNYMGVGLAVPTDAYELVRSDISRLSDTVKFPRVKPKEANFGPLTPVYNLLVKTPVGLWRKLTDYRPPMTEWDTARNRFNSILHATLKCKKSDVSFGVATYHMPCMFRTAADRRVMVIHAGMAAQYALNHSEGLPTVLMGDFNLKPGDPGHVLITTGELDTSIDEYPVMPEGYIGSPFNVKPQKKMESAYARVNGAEPNFTNNARIKDDEPFIDTLDYIFVTDDVEVLDVLDLPHRDEVKGPFPAATEPSDHIMLAATVLVK